MTAEGQGQTRIKVISEPLKRLLNDLNAFEALGRLKGYSIQGYTEESLSAFLDLPDDLQNEKIEQVRNSIGIFLRQGHLSKSGSVSLKDEKASIQFALDEYKLEPFDDLEKIRRNQVIEIYDSNGIQIYRNLEFCKQCGYDLLTLCLYKWFELYERSGAVTDSIFKKVGEALATGNKTIPFDVPGHTMRQKHLNLKKVFYIVPGYVVPLRDKTTKAVRAVLTTLISTEITEAGAADKIVHLHS